jgi:hypothetical protein
VTVFDGSSWTVPTTIDPRAGLTAVSCPSDRFCVAVAANRAGAGPGDVLMFTGSGWTKPKTLSQDDGFASVSCASATACVAGSQASSLFEYDGASWRLRP